jgi:hypothetical protein
MTSFAKAIDELESLTHKVRFKHMQLSSIYFIGVQESDYSHRRLSDRS